MDKKLESGDNPQDQGYLRCRCNKLLCVVKDNDIEIKCNKCKRLMIVKTKGIVDVEIK